MFNHGADVDEVKRKYHVERDLIDFSSNINSFTPSNIIDYINNSIYRITSYPDMSYFDLRSKISEIINNRYGSKFDFENLCVGNGATELIFLLMKSLKGKIGIIAPTFSEYERAAKIDGLEYENFYMKDNEDSFDIQISENEISSIRALFICNPNNPDGRLRNLSRIVDLAEKYGVLLIVDETFIEFCDEEIKYSLINYKYKNIVIIRAITKFYGIPGVRFGYCISKNKALIEDLWSIKEPWSVNSIAEYVTQKIIEDEEFIIESKKRYKIEREFLIDELKKINSISIYDTDSAYILIRIDDSSISSSMLKEKLIINYGIIIRDASSISGLNSSFFRIAIKNREDNICIINALKDIFD